MTRGQLAIITPNGIMTSIEFNGDMYMPTKKWAGHGRTIINALKRVYDNATYQYEVAKFNKDHHHYNDCDKLTYKMDESTLDFTKDYFENWFSDYIYIKNLKNNNVELITEKQDKEGRVIDTIKVQLAPNEIAVLCFGKLVKLVKVEK